MTTQTVRAKVQEQPILIIALGWYAIAGCDALAISILIADFVVPDHDWVADTISDLGAGKYEFIVDIGLYAFSAALIALALLAAHVHLGDWRWSVGILSLAVFGLLVFLIGARNEYGDGDNAGWVIHTYLVYGLGVTMTVACFTVANGAGLPGGVHGKVLIGLGIVWVISAPVFFILPDTIDGVYERYLGVISFAMVITLAHLFITRGRQLR